MKFLLMAALSMVLSSNIVFAGSNVATGEEHVASLLKNSEFSFVGSALVQRRIDNPTEKIKVTTLQLVDCNQNNLHANGYNPGYASNFTTTLTVSVGIQSIGRVYNSNSTENLRSVEFYGMNSCGELEAQLNSEVFNEKFKAKEDALPIERRPLEAIITGSDV